MSDREDRARALANSDGLEKDVEACLRRAVEAGMPIQSKTRLRERVLASVTCAREAFRPRRAFIRAAIAFTVLAAGLTGVATASAMSLPGDPLYELKRAVEEARLAALPEGPARQAALRSQAHRREKELEKLMRRGAEPEQLLEARNELQEAVRAVGTAGVGSSITSSTPSGVAPALGTKPAQPPGQKRAQEARESSVPPRSDRASGKPASTNGAPVRGGAPAKPSARTPTSQDAPAQDPDPRSGGSELPGEGNPVTRIAPKGDESAE